MFIEFPTLLGQSVQLGCGFDTEKGSFSHGRSHGSMMHNFTSDVRPGSDLPRQRFRLGFPSQKEM